jgi:DNA-binding transcriptional LysR family regulator
LLPPALDHLARHHPGIDVQLEVLTSGESMARLAAGRLDLAIVALPQAVPRGVQLTPLRREPVRAYVPASWHPPRA